MGHIAVEKGQSSTPQSCYMCGGRATSREHVPPKCFFPGKNELPSSRDYRVRLITVPSCDRHNITKSGDDQYLLMVIISHWQNNSVAYEHFSRNVLRAIARRPALRQVYMREYIPVVVDGRPSAKFTIDRERFDRSVACIASAIHFHHYHEHWSEDIHIESSALVALNGVNLAQRDAVLKALDIVAAGHLGGQPWRGDNPEIFRYRIHREALRSRLLVEMVFYDGCKVYAHSLGGM